MSVRSAPYRCHDASDADGCTGPYLMPACAWGPGGSRAHLEDGEMINRARIRPLPLAASDLIFQDVLDEIPQDTAERSDLEFLTMSLDRPAIMESQFEISRVEDVEKHRDVFTRHIRLCSSSYVYHRESANSRLLNTHFLIHVPPWLCLALAQGIPCLGQAWFLIFLVFKTQTMHRNLPQILV